MLPYECSHNHAVSFSCLAKNICDKLEATPLKGDAMTKYVAKHIHLSEWQI